MGRSSRRERHHPKRMGEKFRQIRDALKLSQNEMLRRLGSPEGILGTSISGYERGLRVPPLLVLLSYAKVAGVYVDVLIDDDTELPLKLPARPTSEGTRRKNVSRSKSRNI
jgi:transcriptional regulator with XRE-family HTH domain